MNKIQDCIVAIEGYIGAGVSLATTATTLVGAINEIFGMIGDVDDLTTVASTIIGAINEHEKQINVAVGRFDRRQAIPDLAFSLGLELHRSITKEYTVGEEPYDAAYDGTYLWVTNSAAGTISKFNPNDPRKLSSPTMTTVSLTPPLPKSIVYDFDSNSIWVCCYNSVLRINPSTNAVVATITSYDSTNFSNLRGLCLAHTIESGTPTKYVWVVDHGNDRIVQIDMSTNAGVSDISVGDSPDNIIYDGYYLWVTHETSAIVTRIDIYNSSISFPTTTMAVGSASGTKAITFDGESIYVGTTSNGKIYKLNISGQFDPTEFAEVIDLYDSVAFPDWDSCTKILSDLKCDGKFLWAALGVGDDARVYKFDIGHPTMSTSITAECKKVQQFVVDTDPSCLAFDGLNMYILSTSSNTVQKMLTTPTTGVVDHDHSGFGEGGATLSHFSTPASSSYGHVKYASGTKTVGYNSEEEVDISSYSFTEQPLIFVIIETPGGNYSIQLIGEEDSSETNDQYWFYVPTPGTERFVIHIESPQSTQYAASIDCKWWAIGI